MIDEYIKARKTGEKEYKAAQAAGHYPFLPALDYMLPGNDTMSRQKLGLIEIPVEQIAGTKTQARQNSFSPGFMPLLDADTEFAAKWSNLYQAQMSEGFNCPIKVYEYLHRFYVQEGNKRVSVSRFLEMPSITADVTRIIPDSAVLEKNPVYAEFLDFYRVAPLYDIECLHAGSYTDIADALGMQIGRNADKWPEELVMSLKSAYWRFCETVRGMQDSKISDKPLGDAFATYLRIYSGDALDVRPGKELEKRIRSIRKELLTVYNIDNVSLVETSEDAINAGSLITKTGGFITRPGSLIGKVIPQISYSQKHPLKAAFIYDWLPADSDWIYNHEAGRLRLERTYGGIVRTAAFAGNKEYMRSEAPCGETDGEEGRRRSGGKENSCQVYGDIRAAIDAAAEWGADVIFTTSPRQMQDALRAAIQYKDVHFLNCSVNLAHQAVRTYYAKLYEAKFLAGVIAGVYSAGDGSHMIGYCSDYPIYGTIAGINAFAIGAAMTDPKAKIYLEWSTRQNANWWWDMQDRGIHVVSAIDSTHNRDGSNAYGLCYVKKAAPGEGTDLSGEFRVSNLAQPIWKWGKLYETIVKTMLDGTYHASRVDRKDQATNYWWGMISGAVDIKLSDILPSGTRQMIDVLRSSIMSGSFNPFDGELRSQSGLVRNVFDKPLTSKDVITMDWLNENIIGEIPDADSLNDEARETVSVSGIKK